MPSSGCGGSATTTPSTPCDAKAGVIRRLLRKRKKVQLMAFDWTDVRGFYTLLAGAVLKGRVTPQL
jgi:hypothetical protein